MVLPKPPSLEPGRDSLFLDLDGTLASIQPRPDQVKLHPRMLDLLEHLSQSLGGRLAVVSGRELAEVDRLTGGAIPCVAGVHGLDRRHQHRRVQATSTAGVAIAAREFRSFAERDPGLLVEDKGLSTTLHFRQALEHEANARALAERLASEHDLVLQTGKMVFELRTPGGDKGTAVVAFMSEAPFIGSRPWFVGDDDTDEAGFAAASQLGGAGILVGPTRPTAARYRLTDVDAVADWLATGLCAEVES